MSFNGSAPLVLLVSSARGVNTGGGQGHNVSVRFHMQALANAKCVLYPVPLPAGVTPLRGALTFARARHGHLAGIHDRLLADFDATLARLQPFAVTLDSTLFGPLAVVAKRRGCIVFTQSHNCEYDYFAGEAALRGGLSGELLRAAYRAELQAIASSDVVFALSAYDRKRLHQVYGPSKDCRLYNPHLQSLTERLALLRMRDVPVGAPSAVFLGSASHHNRLASELLTERWTGSAATLKIIGNVGQWINRKYGQGSLTTRGIYVDGFLTSLDTALSSADAMVCPMHLGSGIKVKMIDALANGCPILASPEALHGFEFAQESGWVRCCSVDEMEREVSTLRKSNLSLQRLVIDTAQEAFCHSSTLRSSYASFGLAPQETDN